MQKHVFKVRPAFTLVDRSEIFVFLVFFLLLKRAEESTGPFNNPRLVNLS